MQCRVKSTHGDHFSGTYEEKASQHCKDLVKTNANRLYICVNIWSQHMVKEQHVKH